MALFDIFKKKKKKEEKREKIKKVEKPVVEIEKETEAKKPAAPAIPTAKKEAKKYKNTYKILKGVHITEKATNLTAQNEYVFKVFKSANKTEIKKAIEGMYGVDVVNVRSITIPSKKIRVGRIEGEKPGHKKAIVKIKKGQEIEVLPH